MNADTKEIPVEQIEPVFRRARGKEGWEGLKASMKDNGLRMPVGVIDTGRVNAQGTRYKLVYGEGRTLAASSLGWSTIPARILGKMSDTQFAGRFFNENVLRTNIPWAQKGRIIKDEMKAGRDIEEIADDLHIGVDLAKRYVAVLDKTAPELEESVSRMGVNVAERLTKLPAAGQKMVMAEVAASKLDVVEVTKKAEELQAKGEGWTQAALHKAIRATKETLATAIEKRKVASKYYAIGPQNIAKALKTPALAKAMKAAGITITAEDLQYEE